jgi:CBS domain-containing protein
MSRPIFDKLHQTQLEEFLQAKEVHTVKETDTVEAVIKVLNENGIHSCPVVDENNKCVGVIDMLAIAKHIVLMCPREDGEYILEVASRAISLKKIGDLIVEHGTPFVPLDKSEPASMALEVFTGGCQIHRSPVLNHESEVIDSISQSDFIRWFHEQSDTYLKNLEIWDTPLAEAGLNHSSVTTVGSDERLIDVIQKMADTNLYAVAVVDSDGKLVGNFSATDLKAICQENLPSFFVSVSDYLAKHSPTSLTSSGLSAGLDTNHATLSSVLNYFGQYSHHRVWLVEDDKPVGLVTHTDLMTFAKSYSE